MQYQSCKNWEDHAKVVSNLQYQSCKNWEDHAKVVSNLQYQSCNTNIALALGVLPNFKGLLEVFVARKQDNGVFMLAALDEDILTTLFDRELYGLELLDVLNKARRKHGMRDLGVGSLYPALKRMEEQKLIKGRWGEEAGDSNRRRYYSVAFDGTVALQKCRSYRQELAQRHDDWSPVPEGQAAPNLAGFVFS